MSDNTSLINDGQRVQFIYRDHRGELALRTVTPVQLIWGMLNPYYKTERWVLEAFDHDKQAVRWFDMGEIKGWMPMKDGE